MIVKLTSQDMTTHGNCRWPLRRWKRASGKGDLCTKGWLHAYEHPLLAVLHNPIHAAIKNPRLWECEADGKRLRDGQMKQGFTQLRLVRELPLPRVTTEQRVRYAILCAKRVCDDPGWNRWADRWLSGEDRSSEAARAAARAAEQGAADAAMRAARAAARAAEQGAADAATWAADAATWAAYAAAGRNLDLIASAKEAVR